LGDILNSASALNVDQPELDREDASYSGSFITGEFVSGDFAVAIDS